MKIKSLIRNENINTRTYVFVKHTGHQIVHDALQVFTTKKLSDKYNEAMLNTLPATRVTVMVVDFKKYIQTGQVTVKALVFPTNSMFILTANRSFVTYACLLVSSMHGISACLMA